MTQESRPLREGARQRSPFTRILALGYYDGPTEGLLECGPGGQVFRFRLLAWEPDTQDLRIFELAPFPATAFEELAGAFAAVEQPRWPVWVPGWQKEMGPATERVLAQTGPVAWVIATDNLRGEILAARQATAEQLAGVTDWPSFLGLTPAPHFAPIADH